ncbi:MAG TPA: hypothetical protein VEA69_04120 [Tepidisphaeraceae bacterium]|nr:hypothetical protein [Tepidisphaeraceae bacterium]
MAEFTAPPASDRGIVRGMSKPPPPAPLSEFDRALRAIVAVPKATVDAARRKELKAKAGKGASKRKGK